MPEKTGAGGHSHARRPGHEGRYKLLVRAGDHAAGAARGPAGRVCFPTGSAGSRSSAPPGSPRDGRAGAAETHHCAQPALPRRIKHVSVAAGALAPLLRARRAQREAPSRSARQSGGAETACTCEARPRREGGAGGSRTGGAQAHACSTSGAQEQSCRTGGAQEHACHREGGRCSRQTQHRHFDFWKP